MYTLATQSDYIIAGSVLAAAIIFIFLALHFYNKNSNVRKYKKQLKHINKLKEKKYNANVFIDELYNTYITDQTNTYERLKKKGKRKVKRYFRFYQSELDKLAEYKGNISPNKNKNKLIIEFKDTENRVIGNYFIKHKFKKLRKQIDKHQLLFDMIAYVYELPTYIDKQKSYHLENHDNHHTITYKIAEQYKK